MRKVLVLASLAAAGALVAASLGSAMSPKLVGTSGPGFTIEVTMGGKDVKTLKAGTYTIVVHDKSSIHNFHLFGPGLSKKTTVPFTGTQTWTIRLRKGTYTYQCDVHFASGMRGKFTVR
jgi:plastocyanin